MVAVSAHTPEFPLQIEFFLQFGGSGLNMVLLSRKTLEERAEYGSILTGAVALKRYISSKSAQGISSLHRLIRPNLSRSRPGARVESAPS